MSLQNEIESMRKQVVTDGYDMSIGELINMFSSKEIVINPAFQRLFRWNLTQKSRFIESILLGIPIPPIFVYQNDDGIWELVDGLQRLSTVYQFIGLIPYIVDEIDEKLALEGTKYLPSLSGKVWDDPQNGIGVNNQLSIKRTRIRVEILKKESDSFAKYELFQRLNTGGSFLSDQEIRNAIAVMINPKFYEWMDNCASEKIFLDTISINERQFEKKDNVEHFLKFISLRKIPYSAQMDINDYLENSMIEIATDKKYDFENEKIIFIKTFEIINKSLGSQAFRKFDGDQFKGQFLISLYEAISHGVSENITSIENIHNPTDFIKKKASDIWNQDKFTKYVGAGIRGSTRLNAIVDFAKDFFKP